MPHVARFLAGVLLANAVPHGVSAVQGRRFPTPFANPPGVGLSGPVANAVWSALNAAGGVALLGRAPSGPRERISLLTGAVAMTFFLAHYFGKSPQDGKQAATPGTVR
ncbi:hypothetical protein [Arthrobacter sp. zg-Y1171]|uniref:hypothetical protein n=1 Tax=Arthrobacter sp. zg-Y1171 TaxID=2964610 RepID=UPI002107A2EE|nr:hypothetical protein [Arthrobacter sp. zg-Y1171]MCQ1995240.1 hypothetical protein [Arthrobacter sp. zg-Y1171]UWX80718.1 hypothetical protein N2L00_09750 [Arthrobacter sp. zg-Y1171]